MLNHVGLDRLQQQVATIDDAPTELGTLEMVVARPAPGERSVLAEGQLDAEVGLVGDTWDVRGSRRTPDGASHPDMQLNVVMSRVLDAITEGDRTRWALAGDQLVVDLDLSPENLPAGTQLSIGDRAVIEVTDQPHNGCAKFAERFGVDGLKFVNTGHGKARRYRGLNARVITPGTIRPGDQLKVLGDG